MCQPPALTGNTQQSILKKKPKHTLESFSAKACEQTPGGFHFLIPRGGDKNWQLLLPFQKAETSRSILMVCVLPKSVSPGPNVLPIFPSFHLGAAVFALTTLYQNSGTRQKQLLNTWLF